MRQRVMRKMVFMLVTFGWLVSSMGEQLRMPQGELRIVDKHPWNWTFITFNVFTSWTSTRMARWYAPGNPLALAR